MASGARRQRERAETRERILAAAIEIAHEEGWQGVTMRKIAERIEYTHAALYAYFATKEALLLALFRQGTAVLVADLDAATVAADDPDDALLAVGRAYWGFAWRHRELYAVMNGTAGLSLDHPDTIAEGRRIGDAVGATIRALIARHGATTDDLDTEITLLWAAIHGLIALALAGRLPQEAGERYLVRLAHNARTAWGIAP